MFTIMLSNRTTRALAGAVSLGGLALLAACGDRAAKDRAAADSSLTRDLALAGAPTAQPTFQDTAMAPAPQPATHTRPDAPAPVRRHTAPEPMPQPKPAVVQAPVQPQPTPVAPAAVPATVPAPAPAKAEIGAGTGVALTSGSKVCTSSNLPGDKLVATVSSPVTGSNGAVIPAGSTVVLEVASVTPGQNADGAQITFRVRSIVVNDKIYSVAADVSPVTPLEKSKVANDDPNADKKKVVGGAIAGAILGQMIGHNTKGTIIGAATGAAAGAAVAKSGEKWEACLPSGATLKLMITQPVAM